MWITRREPPSPLIARVLLCSGTFQKAVELDDHGPYAFLLRQLATVSRPQGHSVFDALRDSIVIDRANIEVGACDLITGNANTRLVGLEKEIAQFLRFTQFALLAVRFQF